MQLKASVTWTVEVLFPTAWTYDLVKYDLWEYFANYIRDGYFPSKTMWKNIVNKGIKLYEERGYKDCLFDTNLYKFKVVHGQALNIHPLWIREHAVAGHKRYFRDVARFNSVLSCCVRKLYLLW